MRSENPEATQKVAGAVAGLCRVGDVVLLVGDLGAGKTTFAQGFGRALGVVEPIVSPTFTLVRQYVLPEGRREIPTSPGGTIRMHQFVHADLYRLSHRHEIADLGIGQLVEQGVAVVEWGEAAEPVLGDDWLRVDLDFGPADDVGAVGHESQAAEETHRTIRVTGHGGNWPARWSAVESALRPWRSHP
jgi:tRNA threonylcarbamoyladenosine biosynthesis protein TsaE